MRIEYPDIDITKPLVKENKAPTVAYFLNENVSAFHYGEGHPMKPARIALTHNLVIGYGMDKKMLNFRTTAATEEELQNFHEEDYLEFLKRVTPANASVYNKYFTRFNMGVDDCPIFDGCFDFCKLYAGASLEAARKLNAGMADIALNWSGGLHHAKKWEASGFCYVNDIVLAILELLKVHPRVVYIDIDVHHGDGVQEAFYLSNRVMTVSFHRYDGIFFPATGHINERGVGRGKYYAVNVPLEAYITDEAYAYIFRGVMKDVMDNFKPSAIVLQCGSDSLAKDRLGCFNLSIKGHGACVEYMKSFGIPMMCLGGGGYTVRNVARAWTYETSVVTESELPLELPDTCYMDFFAPDYSLHPPISDPGLKDNNTRERLDELRKQIRENLRYVECSPSVQMQELPSGIEIFHEKGDWEHDKYEDTVMEFQGDTGVFTPKRSKDMVIRNDAFLDEILPDGPALSDQNNARSNDNDDLDI